MSSGNAAAVPAVLFFAIAFPAGMLLWWKKRSGAKLGCFLAGAFCFFVFARLLEPLLHAYCLTGNNPVSAFLLASPVACTVYGTLAAGLFEETGRLFAYRVLLKKHREPSCAVAYGIGHGGCEILLILGLNYALLMLVKQGVPLGDESAMAPLCAAADAITWPTAGFAVLERVSAMMLQIGLSMIVFVAARQKSRMWLYPAAILLHALADVPAALYQFFGRPSVAVIEGIIFACGLLYLFLGKRVLDGYARAGQEEDPPGAGQTIS